MDSSFKRIISRTTAPPVSIAEVRDQLFLFTDSQYDTLLDRLLLVATERAEAFTGRYFSAVTSQAWYPSASSDFNLPDEQVTAINSVTYTDTDNQTQTLSSTRYFLDSTAERPVVRIVEGDVFPEVSQRVTNPVIINYTIAEAPLASIHDDIRHAILLYVAEMFEQRSNLTEERMKRIPLASERLLQPYRRWTL